ncbi:MAG: ArsB/NhaD family transporter [Nitrososphaeraceae archaeon]|nr:ArsB/NhaD family transporter [Nitrososphaeraceae archaeon]
MEGAAQPRADPKKIAIGLGLIAAFAVLLFAVPQVIGHDISPMILVSAFILVSVYVVLSFEFLHRTSVALIGAVSIIVAALVLGSIHAEESFDFIIGVIDYNTIGLLLGMMIIVAILAESGVFQWVGIKASKVSKGNLWRLMLMLCTFTAVVSMFIDNVTTVLLMVPVTIAVFRTFKVSPMPFILAQALAANVGGTATLIGDPPNIMIGSAANIDFNMFITHMGPTVAVSFVASLLLMKFLFRKDLKAQVQNLEHLMREDETIYLKDRKLLKKSMVVLIGVIALFVVHGSLQIEPSVIAIGGAAVLLVLTRANPEKVFHEVDWPTLLFFTGLFIIVGTAEHSGMIDILSNAAINITGGDPWLTFLIIIWLSAIASAFVDNIPFTATMIPLIETLNLDPNIASVFGDFAVSPLWWALALGADFGGNGTLIGSSAGVVAAGVSEKNGHPISFNRWFKVGFPFMIVTTAIGTVILAIDILLRL